MLAAVPSGAHTASSECDTSLRWLIQSHDFPQAFRCAEQQFTNNPEDMDALLVMARAAQELGRVELADNLAKEARNRTLTTGQRFAAYLISGISQAQQMHFVTAKALLYRASDFAQADAEVRVVRHTLDQINSSSPWRFGASISVLPSTNINGGSLHDTINLGGFEFVLDDDAKAQSGVAYSASAEATHQTRLSAQTIWENRFSLAGTAYDGRGRNNAGYTVTSGLRHTPETRRPMLLYGYLRYDQRYVANDIAGAIVGAYSPYYSQTTAGLELHRNPSRTSAWKVYGTLTDRQSDTSAVHNAQIGTLGATYRFAVNSDLEIAFGGYVQRTDGASNLASHATNLSLGGTWDPKGVPFTFSGNLNYTHTQYTYTQTGYSEARVDDDVKLELSFAYDNFQFFGLKPSFGASLSRDFSNLNRYDTQNAQIFTRLSAAF